MHFFTDSFTYYCTIHQSKPHLPYLLMLHGFMGSGRVFDHLLDDLASFCNPITIDLGGHGKTKSPTDPDFYSAKRQVRQLHSILRRLQFENLYLYGYSMGGRLAFQLIASYPNLFSGVVSESAHCGIDSETERSDRQKLDKKRAQQIETNFEGFINDWMNLPLFQHTPDQMKLMYQEIMKAQNPKTLSASLRGFGAGVMPSVCDKISGLDPPITLLAGKLDEKYVRRMTEISGKADSSNIQIVENTGHRVHADQPEELITILKNAVNV